MGRITAIAAIGLGLGLGAMLAGCGASETKASTETARRASPAAANPAVLALVRALADAGLDATEATATFTADAQGAAAHLELERMAGVGTLSIVRIAGAEPPIVYVFACDDNDGASAEERAWTIRHCLDEPSWAVASAGRLLVAAGAPGSWPAILEACVAMGGREIVPAVTSAPETSIDASRALASAHVQTVRAQLELYALQHGGAPSWESFRLEFIPSFLQVVPENPFTGGRVIATDFRGDWRYDPFTGAFHGIADAEVIAEHGLDADEFTAAQASATSLDESALMDLYLHLRSIRAALDLFAVQQGAGYPDLAARQWLPLIEDNYLRRTPTNPMSPAPVASRIVEVTGAGADGTAVDPTIAGWVWNSVQGVLYAAGVDDSRFE